MNSGFAVDYFLNIFYIRINNEKEDIYMITRKLEKRILRLNKSKKVVAVTGQRQVGKTTLLKALKDNDRNYVSLDDLSLRKLAREDPKLFLMTYKYPLIIDEVQHAPELLSYIKLEVDEKEDTGMYWLSGSQKFHLMKGVSESLAGRVGLVEMYSLSYAEKKGFSSKVFDPRNLEKRIEVDPVDIFQNIFEGGMPEYIASGIDRKDFFEGYIKTYIERDVRDLAQVGNILAFEKFMVSVASRNGELLNYASIASDAGIDEKTAAAWISVLVNNNIIYCNLIYQVN